MDIEIILRILLAVLWGGIVGAEREYRSKSAGFRTMIMISIGSCVFTILSIAIGGPSNPDRIAANIVTGIGFLGAGVIFRGVNRVNGITTSATIWAVAAVGMGIGGGYYFAAGSACIMILLVLAMLPYIETWIDKQNIERQYALTFVCTPANKEKIEASLKDCHLKYRIASVSKDGDTMSIIWETHGHQNNHRQFVERILADNTIRKFEY